MIVFICFLTLIALSLQQQQQQVTCQSEDDYYHLLYKICSQTIPCKHLYHLYPVVQGVGERILATAELADFVDYRNGRDFQLFRQQLSRVSLFNVSVEGEPVSNRTRNVLQKTMPDDWLPKINISLQASNATPCNEDARNFNSVFVGSALYSMHIYKVTVSDDNYCYHPNERFFVDPLTDKPLCDCQPGKLCDNDSNFNKLFASLLEFLIVSVLAFIIVNFASTFLKRSMLDDLSRQQV